MDGSEAGRLHGTNLRAREGATLVYSESPKWFFVACMETLEVDDWGIRATVRPLPSCRAVVSAATNFREWRMGFLVSRRGAMERVLCRVEYVLRRGNCHATYIACCRTCPSSSAGANFCFCGFGIWRLAQMPMGNKPLSIDES
jgi:hypothetical protein